MIPATSTFNLSLFTAIVCIAVSNLVPNRSQAGVITYGQTDDFESGTANWTDGHSLPDVLIATGGPGGPSDHFLEIVSTGGGGAGSKMIAFNRSQWLGNYLTAGVTQIAMDVDNLGSTPLSIRIALKQTTANPSDGYVSTNAVSLPVGSGWEHAVFSLDASALTAINSPPSLSTILAGPGEFRIISTTLPNSLDGNSIAGTMGVDNVTAVPEPGSAVLLVTGFTVLLAYMWRRRKGLLHLRF